MRNFTTASFRVCLLTALATGAIGATTTIRAQAASTGFALDRFEPSERGSEWFAQDTLDLRGHVRPSAGLVGDWGYKPLVIYNPDGSERTALVQNQLFVHVGAALNLWDRVRFAFNLPVAVYESGHDGTVNSQTFTGPSGAAIGDVRLGADVRLFGRYREPITVALGLQAWIPSGSQDKYTSDGKFRIAPRLQAAGELGGVFVYAARVGIDYRALSDTFDGSPLGTTFTFGASAGARLLDGNLVVGPEVWGSTVLRNGGAFTKQATPFEAIVGAHYSIGDFRVGAGVGPGLSRGFGTPQVRGLLSLEWAPALETVSAPPPRDRDRDGIYDEDDACPDVKGIKSADPTLNGCPEKDTDGDGIVDSKDACVDVKGVATSDPKTNGCPADRDGDGIYDDVDACPDRKGVKSDDPKLNGCPPDRDGDGIYDDVDACPDVKGVKSDDPKKNGCPADRDGDGITDDVDACPDVKGVASSKPEFNGCPPDKDGDGILNEVDACPDAAGPKNADPKKNGCPAAAIVGGEIKILQQVKFKTASDVILPESDKILTEVSKILRDHPEITKIRVEGHTDNQGAPAYNKDLSKKRAASVVKWMTTKGGIDAKRLDSEGFGQEKPIATNDNEKGRQENRRVEFHIEVSSKPGAVKDN
jgi:outer membrane protein OmpA-like peptidoglycan-associated protein